MLSDKQLAWFDVNAINAMIFNCLHVYCNNSYFWNVYINFRRTESFPSYHVIIVTLFSTVNCMQINSAIPTSFQNVWNYQFLRTCWFCKVLAGIKLSSWANLKRFEASDKAIKFQSDWLIDCLPVSTYSRLSSPHILHTNTSRAQLGGEVRFVSSRSPALVDTLRLCDSW